MAEKLTNITAMQYRCTFGACPAVYKSEDGKTLVIVGKYAHQHVDAGPDEGAVEVSADLLRSSLGVAELVEAAEPIAERASKPKLHVVAGGCQLVAVPLYELRTLVAALSRMKGGK